MIEALGACFLPSSRFPPFFTIQPTRKKIFETAGMRQGLVQLFVYTVSIHVSIESKPPMVSGFDNDGAAVKIAQRDEINMILPAEFSYRFPGTKELIAGIVV